MHFAVTQTHVNGERIAAIFPCIGGTFVAGEEPVRDFVEDEVIITVSGNPEQPFKLYRAGSAGVVEFGSHGEPYPKTIVQALRRARAAQGWG